MQTKFKKVHLKSGLSQEELAYHSETSLRMVQTLDQGSRNINKVNITDVVKLAYTLKCKFEDIIEDEEVVEMLREMYKN